MSQKTSPSSSSPRLTRGLVEVFTGNGKGKTTAALGVALRALGHNLRVYIVYFMKGGYPYGEQQILSQLPNISFSIFGQESFVDPTNVKPEEKEEARKALAQAREVLFSGRYDIVILDEINVAAAWKLIAVDDVIDSIKKQPEHVELILTGRYADSRVVNAADLVTEMVKIKHPYDQGIQSRAGIEC